MNPYPPATALILVALVPNPRDMEIARLLGWYRIPLRKAPKVVNVDFIAFYQAGAFGEAHPARSLQITRWLLQKVTTRA